MLKNEGEIFRVSVIRRVLMKLIYNMKYSDIYEYMSEYQMLLLMTILLLLGFKDSN